MQKSWEMCSVNCSESSLSKGCLPICLAQPAFCLTEPAYHSCPQTGCSMDSISNPSKGTTALDQVTVARHSKMSFFQQCTLMLIAALMLLLSKVILRLCRGGWVLVLVLRSFSVFCVGHDEMTTKAFHDTVQIKEKMSLQNVLQQVAGLKQRDAVDLQGFSAAGCSYGYQFSQE